MLKTVSIENYASISRPINIELGKVTFIIGDNEAGKSAICEAIQILFDYSEAYLPNNARFSSDKTVIKGEFLNKNNNDVKVKRIIERNDDNIISDILEVNGRTLNDFSSISSQFKVFLHETYSHTELQTGLELAQFCIHNLTGWSGKQLTKGHLEILKNLARDINESSYRLIENLRWEENGKLIVKLWGNGCRNYSILSTGEQSLVCAEMFLSLSRMSSDYRNVLVIFDDLPTKLVGDAFENLVQRINSITKPNIQFIFTSLREEADSILQSDCKIKICSIDGKTTVADVTRKTPKGVKNIEQKITEKFINNEDEFINSIVIPLLYKMNFSNIKRVTHHGPGELGIDIGPFVGSGFEWRKIILGAQVKACKLTASGKSSNNITELIKEVEKALHNSFFINELNVKVKLDYVLAIVSQHPTIEALTTFHSAFEGNRKVILLTPDRIAELSWKYGLYV